MVKVPPRSESHDHFFQRSVPSSFADPVDGAFNLTGSFEHGRQAVRHGQPQVIVAVNRNNSLRAIRHLLPNTPNELAEFLWNCVTDGVWNIDGPRSGGDHRLDDLIEIGRIGPTRIHR